MNSFNRVTLVVLAALSLSAIGVQAGTLDPRLANLAAGHMPQTRTVFKAFTPAPPDPFSPRLDATGRVQVYILPASPNTALPDTSELTALGAVKVLLSNALHLVQAWVPVSELHALAALADVGRVTVPAYAVVRPPLYHGFSPAPRGATSPVPTGLAIDASAVQAMQANLLQKVNASGIGIKVGVISDDNSGLAASQAAGYLPATVWADPTYPGTTPTPGDPAELTAMLEEVHAMAPNAALGACGITTTAEFLTCYQDFVKWGANVILDDYGFYVVDGFSIGSTNDGSYPYSISQITQANPNVAFLGITGNDSQDFFQALYTASPACTINGTNYSSCMDFGKALGKASSTEIQAIIYDTSIFSVLEWNDPVGTSPDQFVMYLVNSSGTVLAQSSSTTTPDGRPVALLSYTPASSGETDYMEVACQSCTNSVTLKLMGWGDGGVLFNMFTSGSIWTGGQVTPGVLTTAAVAVTSEAPLSVNLEPYSGIGPYLYGNFGATTSEAKPNLTGVDQNIVSGAGGFSASNPAPAGGVYFCGTSATSPNVGALIADMMSADPGQPASFYYSALENTASQTVFGNSPNTMAGCGGGSNNLITGYAAANAGAGLAQGYAALKSFFTFPSTSLTTPIQVADGTTGSYTLPVNLAIAFTATVKAGTNAVSPSNCQWTGGSSPATGATVSWTFPTAGNYVLSANCPDSQGILDPAPPSIDVTAQNIPPPTVTASGSSNTGFNLTLTGYEPLTLTTASSNTAVLPNSGISISSGCGVSTLNCTVSLSPVAEANGTTTITITATDPFGQSGNATPSETYVPPPPTLAISGVSQSGFNLTLTGYEPLTVTAASSDTSIIPNSGISISSGCGSTALTCTVTLSPAAQANGSTTITVTATDPLGQKGSASTNETYTYTPPPSKSGGGGGSMAMLGLMLFGGLLLLRGVNKTRH